MFTGIIEEVGTVQQVREESGNRHLSIEASFTPELSIDQSIAHNGACLTVVELSETTYTVTAIQETMDKTALGELQTGDPVNLERCLKMGDRLDGHMVQGHVDTVAECTGIHQEEGSHVFSFAYEQHPGHLTVPKGSITVNGVSLTVVDSQPGRFSVAIIPYTFDHTSFRALAQGDKVNLEFDIVGKYVAALVGEKDGDTKY